MVYNADNEQGLDFDGINLMLRPAPPQTPSTDARKTGWSNASKRRRYETASAASK